MEVDRHIVRKRAPEVDVGEVMKDAATAVGLTLHDHVIVGRGGTTSFKSAGLL